MTKSSITPDDAIALLNDAYASDPGAMARLVEARVPCNEELADHPTVQVGHRNNSYTVGLMGIINGLFGVDVRGNGIIAASYDDNSNLTGFIKL